MNEIVAIVGSRKWPEPEAVRDYVYSLDMTDKVISGECPEGVDLWAKQYAQERGLAYQGFPPRRDLWGGGDCFKARNRQIAKACDRLVAFNINVGGSGTQQTVNFAKKFGKPVLEFTGLEGSSDDESSA